LKIPLVMNRVPQELTVALSAALAALGGQKFTTKKEIMPRPRQGRRVQSGGSSGMYPTNSADLRIRVPSLNIPRSVPRNLVSMLVWDTVKYDVVIVATSTPTETNFAFTLANHPQYASWTTLFDQYCIPQASVTFRSDIPPGSTSSPPALYTAIDFDNNANIVTSAAIEDYPSCTINVMSTGRSFTRSVKPCVKDSVATASGSTFVSAGLGRRWLDCSQPNLAHYGIRSLMGTSSGTVNILATVTVWYAFRNQI
jgi:hypothetical protein